MEDKNKKKNLIRNIFSYNFPKQTNKSMTNKSATWTNGLLTAGSSPKTGQETRHSVEADERLRIGNNFNSLAEKAKEKTVPETVQETGYSVGDDERLKDIGNRLNSLADLIKNKPPSPEDSAKKIKLIEARAHRDDESYFKSSIKLSLLGKATKKVKLSEAEIELLTKKIVGDKNQTPSGPSPLHQAIKKCHLSEVESLLIASEKIDIEDRLNDTLECTPLAAAMYKYPFDPYNSLHMMKSLIEAGANIDSSLTDANTLLYHSARHGFYEPFCLLLDHGATFYDAINKAARMGENANIIEYCKVGELLNFKMIRQFYGEMNRRRKVLSETLIFVPEAFNDMIMQYMGYIRVGVVTKSLIQSEQIVIAPIKRALEVAFSAVPECLREIQKIKKLKDVKKFLEELEKELKKPLEISNLPVITIVLCNKILKDLELVKELPGIIKAYDEILSAQTVLNGTTDSKGILDAPFLDTTDPTISRYLEENIEEDEMEDSKKSMGYGY